MSDSLHWYDREGNPRHQVPNAKGDGLRNTTIKDAKAKGLLPSVSGITKMLAAPGLEIYKLRELAKQCYLNPPYPGEDMDEWIAEMLDKGKGDSREAMDAGTIVHKAMEQWLTSGIYESVPVQVNGETKDVSTFVAPAAEAIMEAGFEIVAAEKVLVNVREGYAGTTDLIARGPHGERAIVDFKGLALDTPLPTPTGWTTMGEVRVGDYIMSDWGNPTRVVGKSPIFYRPCYRVCFDDGSEITCDNVHLWTVSIGPSKKEHPKTISTEELWRIKQSGKLIRIYNAQPLNLPDVNLPIDPYVLGAWLGDGDAAGGGITLGDRKVEVIREITRRGYKTNKTASRDRGYYIHGLRKQLRENGILGNKHVPAIYFRAGVEQRIDLLRGLMDTDGTWNKLRNNASFVNTNPLLSDAVYELVCSLGWKASRHTYEAKGFNTTCTAYMVNFTPYERNPFLANSRNQPAAEMRIDGTVNSRRRVIKAIEAIESVPTQCISVDSPSMLYLAGRQMVPTHNTRRTKPGKKIDLLDSHMMQLAAYSKAYWGYEGDYWANLYISTTEPGRIEIVEYTRAQMEAAWRAFLNCRDLWIFVNGHDPRSN